MSALPAPAKKSAQAVVLQQGEFKLISRVLYDDTGITLPDSKMTLAQSRLAKRLRSLKLSSFEEYCALIQSPAGQDERKHMLAALTTNVTRFFRESHHFDDLAKVALPPLLERARAGGRVRLWSAACSSGEEPYSMALTVLSVAPDVERLDLKILATDIDPNVLARARSGIYKEESIADVPDAMRGPHFEKGPEPGTVKVSSAVRKLITFNELNLIKPWPMKGRFDVIFCRNVVIYFDRDTQDRLWKNYAGVLNEGGRLYIGHSERLSPDAEPLFRNVGITSYQRA